MNNKLTDKFISECIKEDNKWVWLQLSIDGLNYCECGCGQVTEIRKGIPNRFINWHIKPPGSLGLKHSNETKRKISNTLKGRKGKKRSFESRRKQSNAMKGRFVGIRSPNWKGGISYGKYCSKFNNKIKTEIRDKYMNMCLICGKTKKENNNKELDVHHVDYNKNQGCDEHEWRLVPLCRRCHTKTNHDREKWERRIKIILEVIG